MENIFNVFIYAYQFQLLQNLLKIKNNIINL